MKKLPVVSVIVPTKNSGKFLEACLKSIRKQSYKNIEIIVVDNHSTDDTPTIAKRYADKFSTKGPERSAQRNNGVKESSGEYLAIIDSDMELTRDVVKTCIKKLQTSKDIKAIIIPEESFGVGFWAQCKKLERSFYVGIDWIEAARFFDKNLYLKVGGYNEKLISGEDWDLSQRIGKVTKIARINQYIHHNEGKLKLKETLKKKYYYATQFKSYLKESKNSSVVKSQAGPLTRYKLFFSQPKMLFKNPILGIGMIFMKTSEFAAAGFGLVRERLRV